MYNLINFCCICFNNNEHLQPLSNSDSDNITYFIKLTSCVPEMCFNELNDQRLVCDKCCEIMDVVYMFRQRCLRSKTKLTANISQLHQVSNINDETHVYLIYNNTFGDIKEKYPIENYIEETEMFIKLNEDTNKDENCEINPITEFKTENNPTILKSIETGHNLVQLENVLIKMEPKNKNSEESFDNILINQYENKIVSQNDVKITPSIKKENKNQDFEEHLQERFDNILETCDSENEDMEKTKKENYDYSLYLKKCTDNLLTNLDEIKIDIVDNDIESANNKINIKYENENNEKLATEVNVISLKKQVQNKTDKEANFNHKSLDGKEKHISLIEKPKQQIKYGGINEKVIIVKNYVCNVCKNNFSHSSSLSRHMRIHTGDKSYDCNLCQKKFTQSSSLRQHIRSHTGEKPHECSVCQKKFTRLYTLRDHMKIHTAEKPHKCDVCQRKFTCVTTLMLHKKIHTKVNVIHKSLEGKEKQISLIEKPKQQKKIGVINQKVIIDKNVECNVCKKNFSYSSSLSRHMRIHTGEKSYECNLCQKKFTQSSTLGHHMKSHTGEKPHECGVCQKKFTRSSTLREHMKVHTGEKPHKCDVCQRNFTWETSLMLHKRIHISKVP